MRLKTFKEHELLFTEQETKEILALFFPSLKNDINELVVTDFYRGFAQSLLLEAIDATYNIGFLLAIYESTINPTLPLRKIIEKLITNLAPHFYRYATQKDLRKVKIYEFVIRTLESRFKSYFSMCLDGIVKNKPLIIPHYANTKPIERLWRNV
ncbi:hypothetical protein L4C42_00185 [Vibrio wakamikoensis]|uniref:hypothetical protein n=1 Tax=Vibrio wakamikoensis TaxID=2910251 RepID=UPI003D23B1B1